jgi:DNA-binding NarL/FixJ family response regulator
LILLIEDNSEDATLIRMLLTGSDGHVNQIVHVQTLAEAASRLTHGDIDAVLLDLGLPDGSGVDCVAAIRRGEHDVPVVVLTGRDDDNLALACIAAGAQDYVSKQAMGRQALARALGYAIARTREMSAVASSSRAPDGKLVHEGLSARELEIFKAIARGKSIKTIAAELSLSDKTVATYLARIREKTGLESLVDIARYALRHGVVD